MHSSKLWILLLFSSVAAAQTTIVTGQIKDPAGNIYVNAPITANFINPSAKIALWNNYPMAATTWSTDSDSNGNFTLSLPDLNFIAPATGTYYTFRICANTTPGTTLPSPTGQPAPPCFTYTSPAGLIVGPTISITSQIQAVSISLPVVPQPASLTANNTFSGNNTFTGSTLVKSINAIQKCDPQVGATADVQITNAIAALPAGGGFVDCTGYGQTTQTIAGQVVIGTSTKRVFILFDARTLFNITVTSGVDVFPLSDGSDFECAMMGGPQGFGNTNGFTVTASANIKSVLAPATRSGFPIFMTRGCTFYAASASSTITNAVVEAQGTGLGSRIQDTTIYLNGAFIGFRAMQGTSTSASDLEIINLQVNGQNATGAKPCILSGNGATTQLLSVSIIDGGCQHAGSGQYELTIDGLNGGVGTVAGVQGVKIMGSWHLETATGSLGISIKDASDVKVGSVSYSGSGATNAYTIAESGSGITQDIEIASCRCTSGSLANYIVNSAAGGTTIANISTAPYVQPEYLFKAPVFGFSFSEVASCQTPTAAGLDTLCGNSTSHTLSASYNNGSSFPLAQIIASGTAVMTTAAIAAGACGTTVTVPATNVLTTDSIAWAFNAAPGANPAQLPVSVWPTAGNVNFQYCNPSAGSITPNAATLNWKVPR